MRTPKTEITIGEQSQDELWPQIREALTDDKWAFRTVRGISDEIDVDPGVVEEELEKHASEVRKSINWKSPSQEQLYTIRTRKISLRERISDAQALLRRLG